MFVVCVVCVVNVGWVFLCVFFVCGGVVLRVCGVKCVGSVFVCVVECVVCVWFVCCVFVWCVCVGGFGVCVCGVFGGY